ncbi:hypothetical protein PQE75_gp010 [Bacillus phage vB_BcoS-136]|uniref:Uncharacterized protein n=1 Tax=Bacillus phage vB_BcoS-136 TaxID=2419619 RepID=A0A3G3BV79_9CAUD|nr:hypothetical protein PQE75_gp010 [Bacillus phage vB_BcoS-136]AYP68142.1 hypothetical protein vBBcoS136_00010 [Bacillus phage vB_BcoS-136]
MNKSKSKFKVGDIVKIREDLKVGATYFNHDSKVNDTFTIRMKKYLGKTAQITRITDGGKYELNIDNFHTYTDDMFEVDTIGEEYEFNHEVEKLVRKLEKDLYYKKIDEALENRLFETNPKEFNEILEKYNKL